MPPQVTYISSVDTRVLLKCLAARHIPLQSWQYERCNGSGREQLQQAWPLSRLDRCLVERSSRHVVLTCVCANQSVTILHKLFVTYRVKYTVVRMSKRTLAHYLASVVFLRIVCEELFKYTVVRMSTCTPVHGLGVSQTRVI